jgi:hypothetical protein
MPSPVLPSQDRISKCRFLRNCLRPRIERLSSDAHIFCPGRNQPPTHGCELASFLSFFFADGDDLLGRRDVLYRGRSSISPLAPKRSAKYGFAYVNRYRLHTSLLSQNRKRTR